VVEAVDMKFPPQASVVERAAARRRLELLYIK